MQLIYRGIAHELVTSLPSISLSEETVSSSYRGLAWNWQARRAVPTLPSTFPLRYRGCAVNGATRPVAVPSAPGPASLSPQHFRAMLEKIHRQNLMQRLQQRIRSAQARGDEHLLRQLEQERQLLAELG